MANILIVDDDENIRGLLACLVKKMGHEYKCANTLSDGLKEALQNPYDVIFLDVILPDGHGLDALAQFKQCESSPDVIIFTGFADSKGAEYAIMQGAWDYIEKGSEIDSITIPLLRALQHRSDTRHQKTISLDRTEIIGDSAPLKQCLDQLAKAADSSANVLLTGESGTGKELFALAIHNNSSRSKKNFVTVDCASLPEKLIESLLFGHEKGSFTGADKKRDGLIFQANGGTLFLDEIGELSAELQKSFLRVLQERRYRPVGSENEITCDFRLVSATNKNLEEMVARGKFRNDLLYRLNAFVIHLPTLYDRKSDIKAISLNYISNLCEKMGIESKAFSSDFFDTLLAYDWPGNIRELKNALENALIASTDEPRLYPQHLPVKIRVALTQKKLKEPQKINLSLHPVNKPLSDYSNITEFKNSMEYEFVRFLLESCDGEVTEASRRSGLSRSGFYKLLKKHHLMKEDS